MPAEQRVHRAFAHVGETEKGRKINIKAALNGIASRLPVLTYGARLLSGVETIWLHEIAQGDNPLLAQ